MSALGAGQRGWGPRQRALCPSNDCTAHLLTHTAHGPPSLPAHSYGAFWMSLAIYTTLAAAGVFVGGTKATAGDFPVKGDRLMLTLWGILVRPPGLAGWRCAAQLACACAGSLCKASPPPSWSYAGAHPTHDS